MSINDSITRSKIVESNYMSDNPSLVEALLQISEEEKLFPKELILVVSCYEILYCTGKASQESFL